MSCSRGDWVRDCFFNSIDKLNAPNYLSQLLEAPEPSPGLLRTPSELKHHVEHAISRETAIRLLRPMANGAERGFNRIRGSQTRPVLSWKRIEREQLLPIFL